MASSVDLDVRQRLGDQYLSGTGIEVGAGLAVTHYKNVRELIYVDKRDHAEFVKNFGREPPYTLLSLPQAYAQNPGGVDFLVAHHVIEHCANPIRVLAFQWLTLVQPNGILFLSMPSSTNPAERERLPTPIDHVLDDFFFHRSDYSYESRQHIYSFILQWTAYRPGSFWYEKRSNHEYARAALSEVVREEQDLHWHTFTLESATSMVEVAFHAAGASVDWLARHETSDTLYLVGRRASRSDAVPACLEQYAKNLLRAADAVAALCPKRLGQASLNKSLWTGLVTVLDKIKRSAG
jgi:hypothetical protein